MPLPVILSTELREELIDALTEEIKGDTPYAEGSYGYLGDLLKMKVGDEIGEDHPLRDPIELFQLEGATSR